MAFDERTWWGEVCYDLTVLKFHGTSVRGITSHYLPKPGDLVTIVFNDAGRIICVEPRRDA